MKKISRIFASTALLVSAVACSHVAKFTADDFVIIVGSGNSVSESSGSFQIPVSAYAKDGSNPNTTVTFEVVNGTAVSGTNFTVEPADGVLTFSGSEKTKYITVNVIDQDGVFTGALNFSIRLTGATNEYHRGAAYAYNVTILDDDHPLSAILGEWTGSDYWGYWGDDYNGETITITAVEDDVTKVNIYNLDPYLGGYGYDGPAVGQVDDEKTTITVAAGQGTGYGTFGYYGFNDPDPDNASSVGDIIIKILDDGTLLFENAWGSRDPAQGWMEILLGGAVFSK